MTARRIRLAVALAFILGAVALATPAWAGPNAHQPAQVRLTLGEARHYARVSSDYVTVGMDHHQKAKVGACTPDAKLDRKLWKCDVSMVGAQAHCTMVVWIWGERDGGRVYEYHNLRCS